MRATIGDTELAPRFEEFHTLGKSSRDHGAAMRTERWTWIRVAVSLIIFCSFVCGCGSSEAKTGGKAPKGRGKPSRVGTSSRDERMKSLERALYRLGVKAGKLDRKIGTGRDSLLENNVTTFAVDPPSAYAYLAYITPLHDDVGLAMEASKCLQGLDKLSSEKQMIAIKYFIDGYTSQRPARKTKKSPAARQGGPKGTSARRDRSSAGARLKPKFLGPSGPIQK